MPTFFQCKSFIRHWLDAVNQHSLHSPFFFDFYTKILKGNSTPEQGEVIENIRAEFLKEKTILTLQDFGARSIHSKNSSRTIAQIAASSLSQQKFSRLFVRIIQHFNCKHVVELGTSLGINTLYLATAPGVNVTTFEGDPHLVKRAEVLFESQSAKIIVIPGNIDKTLSAYLQQSHKVDLAFIDANHRYAPTMLYANELIKRMHDQSLLILDDIHHSPEMQRAWDEIRQHKLVYASIDLFRCGILIFNPSLNKQHVVLQF